MNIHIKLVKKWLADPASVSQEELKDNRTAANAAANAAAYAADADAYAAAADAPYINDAAYWVKRYEKLKGQE
jgi:hypothetical protein